MTNPLQFSIITTSYNRRHILPTTIQSVFSQEFKNFEYIIVDDGSTDGTDEYIAKVNDPRIRYIKLEKNQERGYARNRGIEMAKGRYVTILDSDDIIFPNHLSEANRFIENNPDIAFFANTYEIVQKNEDLRKKVHYPNKNFIKNICKTNSLAPVSIFILTKVAQQNPFDEDYNFILAEDLYVWLNIASQHGIQFNDAFTCSCVRHDESTMNNLNPEHVLYCRDKLIALLKEKPAFYNNYSDCFKELYSNQTSLAILAYTMQGDYKIAVKMCFALLKNNAAEIFRKRTLVIFRNIFINYLRHFKQTFQNYFFEDYWEVGTLRHPPAELLNGSQTTLHSISVKNEPDCYYADPFIIENEQGTFLLVENFNLVKQKGDIALLVKNDKEEFVFKKNILTSDTHYSYPTVFTWKDQNYFICENSEVKGLQLYYIDHQFNIQPYKKLLEDKHLVDPNVFVHEGLLWLAFTDAHGLTNGNLQLYYAADIGGPWHAHQMNPIKISTENSRGGGSWFTWDGKIYRPAQNCKKIYGHSLVINCITELTPEKFKERRAHEISTRNISIAKKPLKLAGTHTYNFSQSYFTIDYKSILFTPLKTWHLFLKKISKIWKTYQTRSNVT